DASDGQLGRLLWQPDRRFGCRYDSPTERTMNSLYALSDTSSIYSPALLFYKDLIRRNLAVALEIAGGPQRLRPHVKTHKTRELVYLELHAGVTRPKSATLADPAIPPPSRPA